MSDVRVGYEIDSCDWSSGEDDREKCVWALEEWFDGLSLRTQLAIHYSQGFNEQENNKFDTYRNCPWQEMVQKAQWRILKRFAPWAPGTGFNLGLYTTGIET